MIILEENLQGASPYTAEEIQQLTDLGNNRIIFLLDRCHYGDEYVHDLYCCGVYDAFYLDEVSADGIMKLIKDGRNCAQSREYYGICTMRDAERQRNVVDENYLNAYLECIEEGQGTEEINTRYRFATTRLGAGENRILAESITSSIAVELAGNEIYQFYKGGSKEKRHWFSKRKTSVAQDAVSVAEEEETKKYGQETEQKEPKTEKISDTVLELKELQESDAEDMLAIMERFRRMTASDVDIPVTEAKGTDLLILMGGYLQTVDVSI